MQLGVYASWDGCKDEDEEEAEAKIGKRWAVGLGTREIVKKGEIGE